MTRRFDLLTQPVRDNESIVTSARVGFLGACDFVVEVAKPIQEWFAIELAIFDGKTFAVRVRRRGTSPVGVVGIRFSAMVTCNTDDGIIQRRELMHAYWPPPESELFVMPKHSPNKHGPVLPIFLSPQGNLNIAGLQVLLTNAGEPLSAVFEADSATAGYSHYIPFEAPIRLVTPRNKMGREWAHFSGAREDLQRGGIDLLDGAATLCVPDPPDIRIQKDGSTSGVELAQLVSGDRRQIVAATDRLCAVISKAPRSNFDHLRNQLVLVGFATPTGMPPREFAPDEFGAIVKNLAGQEAKAAAYSDGADLRDGFTIKITNLPAGQESIGLFPLPTEPHSAFGQAHGFDLAASFTLVKTRRAVSEELTQLIHEKDKPGNDILLISAGAPSFGSCLVSDEVLVAPQMLEFMTFPQPKHLKRVLLHRWAKRDVYELAPELRCLVAPIRHAPEGGVTVVSPRSISEAIWAEPCFCGQARAFRDCHGA